MKEIKEKEEVERFLKQFMPKLDIWGICISFHESEYKIEYAFKGKKGDK